MRAQTWAPCTGKRSLSHWTTREVPRSTLLMVVKTSWDPHFLYDHVWPVHSDPLFLFRQKSILFPLYHTGYIRENLSSHWRIQTGRRTHRASHRHRTLRRVCLPRAWPPLLNRPDKSVRGPAQHAPWPSDTPSPFSAFGSKLLLGHSHVHPCKYCPLLPADTDDLTAREVGGASSLALLRKVCWPLHYTLCARIFL